MGAYSPVPWVDDAFMKKVTDEVLTPTVDGLAADGIPFYGVIYAGIMIRPDGSLSVLEYNVRLGDPEAQVVLPAFGGDFGEVALGCAKGELASVEWPGAVRTALGVVMASAAIPKPLKRDTSSPEPTKRCRTHSFTTPAQSSTTPDSSSPMEDAS